jgi:hypothetical protein
MGVVLPRMQDLAPCANASNARWRTNMVVQWESGKAFILAIGFGLRDEGVATVPHLCDRREDQLSE